MTEPRRLIDGGGTEIERMLVTAARAARPSRSGRFRTAIALVLASIGISPKAGAALLLTSGARGWIAARWLFIVVGAGTVTWGVVHHVRQESHRAMTIAAVEGQSPTAAGTSFGAAPAERAPEPALSAAVEPVPSAAPEPRLPHGAAADRRPTRADPAPPASSVASEIRELDAARQAILSGDPRGALDRLDGYARLYPEGAMHQEAMRLRIEALVAVGDRTGADQLMRRFLTLYPNSPHARRLKSLVSAP